MEASLPPGQTAHWLLSLLTALGTEEAAFYQGILLLIHAVPVSISVCSLPWFLRRVLARTPLPPSPYSGPSQGPLLGLYSGGSPWPPQGMFRCVSGRGAWAPHFPHTAGSLAGTPVSKLPREEAVCPQRQDDTNQEPLGKRLGKKSTEVFSFFSFFFSLLPEGSGASWARDKHQPAVGSSRPSCPEEQPR